MTDLPISPKIAERLNAIARQENRPLDDLLTDLLNRYQPPAPPAQSDDDEYYSSENIKKRLYARVRRYWQKHGDQQRLALTDAELDEQFWLIDNEGIPRLKSEQGTIELLPDPLEKMAEMAKALDLRSGRSDISANFDEVLAEYVDEEMRHRRKEQDRE